MYVQYACTQPVSVQPALKKWQRPFIGARWLFLRSGPGRDEPLRGGRVRPLERRRRVPEPHVPLPAARDPLRRLAAGGEARLPGARRADVLGRARLGEDRRPPIRACSPALRFNYLSTEQDRREWVEAIRVARRDPRAAGVRPRTTAARRRRARRCEATTRSSTGSRATPRRRCTRRARARWGRVVDPATMRVLRARRPARRRRVRLSVSSRTGTSTRPVMMVAEKAADLIRGNTPLPAEEVDFYRHRAERAVGR